MLNLLIRYIILLFPSWSFLGAHFQIPLRAYIPATTCGVTDWLSTGANSLGHELSSETLAWSKMMSVPFVWSSLTILHLLCYYGYIKNAKDQEFTELYWTYVSIWRLQNSLLPTLTSSGHNMAGHVTWWKHTQLT